MTHKHTYILLTIVSLLLTSSIFLVKNDRKKTKEKKADTQGNIDDYTDAYAITPKKDLPKFKELEAAFEQQVHRFEIEKCQFKYNEQPFFMGDSPGKIIQIFGVPNRKVESEPQNFILFDYKELQVEIKFSYLKREMTSFLLKMAGYDDVKNKHIDIIKFRQIPYQLGMKLNDFMALSNLTHDKLRRDSFHFFMLQKECPPSETERIYTNIGSSPAYEVEGGGHLTWTGDFNPNKSYSIKKIGVEVKTLESFKK